MAVMIADVFPGSLAFDAGLKSGDEILEINGIEIKDYLDYMYASCREDVEIKLTDRNVSIVNEDYLPLGIEFETLLIDKPRSCMNKCVFCFIDQLPKNMRETCYFKDDDYRLSFLQGNYVSMTNMHEEDVERILRYNIPRINISVHTTNPELRVKMLNNKNAGKVLEYLKRFADGGLNINAQIVLCPGINDKEELDRTLKDLGDLGEGLESVSVVPVGLTDHRSGLAGLSLFDEDSANEVIKQIEIWQDRFLKRYCTRLVYLSDEFYIMAKKPIPEYDAYEGFPQIENGVGLCSSLIYEFKEAANEKKSLCARHKKTIPTGKLVYEVIKNLTEKVSGDIQVIPIENNFFGKNITVTGLICGRDLIEQLKGIDIGRELLISSAMLRHDEPIFLDNITVSQVERELNTKVRIVPNDGYILLDALLD